MNKGCWNFGKKKARKQIRELRAKDYKQIPFSCFWLCRNGTVYNAETQQYSNPKIITTGGKQYRTEKVVLWLFKGIAPRNGKIHYADGNAANKSADNVSYCTVAPRLPKETVNRENLRTALRCYFNLDKKGKSVTNNIAIRILLCGIYKERGFDFAAMHGKSPCFSEFEKWLLVYDFDKTINRKPPETYTARERNAIHAHYINLFTSEICSDLQNGLLTLQPYKETKRERRKKETALMHEHGIKRKTTARLPKNIRAGFVELGLQPVKLGFVNNSKIAQYALMIKAKHELQTARHTLPPENAAQIENLLQMIENKIETLKNL